MGVPRDGEIRRDVIGGGETSSLREAVEVLERIDDARGLVIPEIVEETSESAEEVRGMTLSTCLDGAIDARGLIGDVGRMPLLLTVESGGNIWAEGGREGGSTRAGTAEALLLFDSVRLTGAGGFKGDVRLAEARDATEVRPETGSVGRPRPTACRALEVERDNTGEEATEDEREDAVGRVGGFDGVGDSSRDESTSNSTTWLGLTNTPQAFFD